ncbi:uncharacterized protein KY384_000397 [Bacidia gigantensis]|uniref:uncharacterized protein n=1 Tax=Bacidia gigantensis TaxID=2732470 RepID=UPI001D03C97C|nr:uncharacterized protein KY384_000397 [Bacidia gigantensis]KAG8525637.1 hypothetical protein KY384_000397 [Bacidia gigantensis]
MQLSLLLWWLFACSSGALADLHAVEPSNTTHVSQLQIHGGSTILGAENFNSIPIESPPNSFGTVAHYKKNAQPLSRYDAWLAVTACLAEEAVKDWNDSEKLADCQATRGIKIRVVKSQIVGASPLLVQHIMCSLIDVVAGFWEEQDPPHYAETIFQPQQDDVDMGIGSILMSPTIELNSSNLQLDANDYRPIVKSSTPNVAPSTDRVRIDFDPDIKAPALCNPFAFYIILMNAIVHLGPTGSEDYVPGIRLYDSPTDVTFQIGASNEHSKALKQFMIVSALNFLAMIMNKEPIQDRFRPFLGGIRWNKERVAFISFQKGKLPPPTVDLDSTPVMDRSVSSTFPSEILSTSPVVPNIPTLTTFPDSTY